jgi:hypothetical protein
MEWPQPIHDRTVCYTSIRKTQDTDVAGFLRNRKAVRTVHPTKLPRTDPNREIRRDVDL